MPLSDLHPSHGQCHCNVRGNDGGGGDEIDDVSDMAEIANMIVTRS